MAYYRDTAPLIGYYFAKEEQPAYARWQGGDREDCPRDRQNPLEGEIVAAKAINSFNTKATPLLRACFA